MITKMQGQRFITVTAPAPKIASVQVLAPATGMSLVDLGKRLLDAAKRGDTDAVRALMSNGAPFTTDWLGTSPLHFAAQFGHHQTAEVLLRSGISRDARTKVDRTPLHVACQEGHIDIVELLLTNSADIEAKDMLKMTPLHWASDKGHTAIVDLLVRHGADLHCEDKFDRTPLDVAISNGRTEIAQMLQLAQHTDIGGVAEGETITIETTEPIMTETVTTSGVKTEVSSDSEQSSTSVLATLAALAEATAPINNASVTSEAAVSWLESQGITLMSSADGGLITSAVESGQTITLTEAGKIALNYIRQDGLGDGSHEETGLETVVGEDGQNVITIVANQGGAELQEDGSVLVAVAEDGTELPVETQIVGHGDEVVTEVETEDLHQAIDNTGTLIIEDGDGTTITVSAASDEQEAGEEVVVEGEAEATAGHGDHDAAAAGAAVEGDDDGGAGGDNPSSKEKLELELQMLRQQAQDYKERLRVKSEEAAKLTQRLSEIQSVQPPGPEGDGEGEEGHVVTEEEAQSIRQQLASLEAEEVEEEAVTITTSS